MLQFVGDHKDNVNQRLVALEQKIDTLMVALTNGVAPALVA